MNERVKNETIQGIPLTLDTLGITSGIIDAATQFPSVSHASLGRYTLN